MTHTERYLNRIAELEPELSSRIQLSNSWAEAATKANERIKGLNEVCTAFQEFAKSMPCHCHPPSDFICSRCEVILKVAAILERK